MLSRRALQIKLVKTPVTETATTERTSLLSPNDMIIVKEFVKYTAIAAVVTFGATAVLSAATEIAVRVLTETVK